MLLLAASQNLNQRSRNLYWQTALNRETKDLGGFENLRGLGGKSWREVLEVRWEP